MCDCGTRYNHNKLVCICIYVLDKTMNTVLDGLNFIKVL
nr:MAG TPA: hypothetical protein [Bacteriophage sp.]